MSHTDQFSMLPALVRMKNTTQHDVCIVVVSLHVGYSKRIFLVLLNEVT